MGVLILDGSLDPSSLVVFDAEGSSVVLDGGTGAGGVLVLDDPDDRLISSNDDDLPEEIVVVEHGPTGSVMSRGRQETVYLGESQIQTDVLIGDRDHTEFIAITDDGPPGPRGPEGDRGEQGPRGETGAAGAGSFYQEFNFATPVTTWHIPHGLGTFGINVEAVDLSGESLEGGVRYLDQDVIEVDWYYPTAGSARLFR